MVSVDVSPPPLDICSSVLSVEHLSLDSLRALLADADDNGRRELFCALTEALGPSEASRRWLAVFAASDAAPT